MCATFDHNALVVGAGPAGFAELNRCHMFAPLVIMYAWQTTEVQVPCCMQYGITIYHLK
jgi:hypothetical protein